MSLKKIIKLCVVVLGAVLCLHTAIGSAGMMSADQAIPLSQIQLERLRVQTFMDRAEVKDRLQSLGVVEIMSKVRVASMTDQEVHAMVQEIDNMPAGGRLRDSDLVIILLIILLLLLI